MKKLLLLLTLSAATLAPASAQRLITGERAPEVRVGEWLNGSPSGDKPMLIEFYHSSSKQSQDRIPVLDDLARQYGDRLSVVVITREPRDRVMPLGLNLDSKFHVALDDDGKTFANYNVQFVPFSALIDSRGKLAWFGNPSSLSESELLKHL